MRVRPARAARGAGRRPRPHSVCRGRRPRELVRRLRHVPLHEPPAGHLAGRSSTSSTKTHAGYCQYFAGAMALMLRYLGIPARVAVGFAGGTYDRSARLWNVTRSRGARLGRGLVQGLRLAPVRPDSGRARRRAALAQGRSCGHRRSANGRIDLGSDESCAERLAWVVVGRREARHAERLFLRAQRACAVGKLGDARSAVGVAAVARIGAARCFFCSRAWPP